MAGKKDGWRSFSMTAGQTPFKPVWEHMASAGPAKGRFVRRL